MELNSFDGDFADALEDAFVEHELDSLIYLDLHVKLDNIAGPGPFPARILQVWRWAERQGKLELLFVSALKRNSRNRKLRAFATKLKAKTDLEQDQLFNKAKRLTGANLLADPGAENLRNALD